MIAPVELMEGMRPMHTAHAPVAKNKSGDRACDKGQLAVHRNSNYLLVRKGLFAASCQINARWNAAEMDSGPKTK